MAEPPKTRWGDRAQRRVDILTAARDELAKAGYVDISMRDVAAGAGLSVATLYSYFETKQEIFAALFAERLEGYEAELALVCEQADDLERFLGDVVAAYQPVYREFGRHFSLWALTRPDADPSTDPEALSLLEPAQRILAAVADTLARLGAFADLPDDERALVLPFLWVVLTGFSDHVTGGRQSAYDATPEDLAAFTSKMLVRALRGS
jgi:AcrR family transcriptional regulator